jgi:tetratricopeptide (TPR) repeat protein
MKTQPYSLALVAVVPLLVAVGCSRVQSRAAFKDGNKLYKEENYRKAIDQYERAVKLDPGMAEAYFYLASSNQALYRPGKEGDDNKQRLQNSIDNYNKSLEVNKATSPNLKKVKLNALAALTGIYSEAPFQDYEKALDYATQLVAENPNDTKNLYAMANLYEKFGKVQEAEAAYVKVTQLNPQDAKACGALANFYNKPLWDGRSRFDEAIQTLERCAELAPNDPSGYYKVATFFWDKAYRDPLLNDQQKDAYADKGLEAVNKALGIKPDYWEAIISKGLLYRVKALVAKNPKVRAQYLDQAQTLQKQALDLRKSQQGEAAGASPPPEAPPEVQ